jgi:hypothetical protein
MLLLPTCIGIEMTSGFDSQMINTVQISPAWQACRSLYIRLEIAAHECRLPPPKRSTPRYYLIGV